MQDNQESYMPAYIRYPIGAFVALTITPMILMLTLPFLLFGPLAAPFCLMAFVGDWAEEKDELEHELRERPTARYRTRALRPARA